MSDSTTVTVVDRSQFASKAAFVGSCLGITTAVAVGGPATVRLLVAVTSAVIVGGGLYLGLLALATRLTAGSSTDHDPRRRPQPESVTERETRSTSEPSGAAGGR